MNVTQLLSAGVIASLGILLSGTTATATSFQDAITVREGAFTNFINAADARSWDGTGTSAFDAFSAYVNPGEFLSFGAFEGVTGIEAQLLYELTSYDDVNRFGLVNEQGAFTDLIVGSDVAGSGRSVDVADGSYRFAVNSPAGVFSAVDSENSGNISYVIGQRILQDGKVSLFGNEFTVTAGQYVLFFEDLAGLVPHSDQDYNDGVVLLSVTSAEVPEPATLSLLLAGLGGFKLRRKPLTRS